MSEINNIDSSSQSRKATILIFLVLITLRISDRYLPELLLGINEIPVWYSYFYISITFVLTSAVLLVNRNNLYKLNIDSSFITIFIISGLIVSMFYLPISVGFITGISTIVVYAIWKKEKIIFRIGHIKYIEILIFLVIGITPNLIYYLFFIMPNSGITFHLNGSILPAISNSRFHDVVFEEVLYRGILWMLLKDFKLRDSQIIVIQALLFWFSHYYYIDEPLSFWVYLPWMSLLLGIVIWHSKSISSSTFVHFLYNILMSLFRQSL